MFPQSFRSYVLIITFACCAASAFSAKANNTTADQVKKPNAHKDGRIVNGVKVKRGEAGFVVQIVNKKALAGTDDYEFICGGTLISEQHVLTAAHCLRTIQPNMVKVIFGEVELKRTVQKGAKPKYRAVQEIMRHPQYQSPTYHADVAVLKLQKKVVFGRFTKKASLCPRPLQGGEELVVYGWGRVASDSRENHTNDLFKVAVPVLPTDQCEHIYNPNIDASGEVTDLMFCAGLKDGKDACQGDSGGPAMVGNAVCGIVSWGYGCAHEVHPGIYTSISAVRDFIENSLKK